MLFLEDFIAFCAFYQCWDVYLNHFLCLGYFDSLRVIEIWLLNLAVLWVFLSFQIFFLNYFRSFRDLRLFWPIKNFHWVFFLDILCFWEYFGDIAIIVAILVISWVFFCQKNNFTRKSFQNIKKPINKPQHLWGPP